MKRRSTPLGCFIALCVIWLIANIVITIQFIAMKYDNEARSEIYATSISFEMDNRVEMLKSTDAALSATLVYWEYQQQHLTTPTPH